jgi:hypothetical protein
MPYEEVTVGINLIINQIRYPQQQRLNLCPVSLAQLVGHCMIYAGDRGSNPGHPTYPSLWVEFLAIRLLDQKKKKIEFIILFLCESQINL